MLKSELAVGDEVFVYFPHIVDRPTIYWCTRIKKFDEYYMNCVELEFCPKEVVDDFIIHVDYVIGHVNEWTRWYYGSR